MDFIQLFKLMKDICRVIFCYGILYFNLEFFLVQIELLSFFVEIMFNCVELIFQFYCLGGLLELVFFFDYDVKFLIFDIGFVVGCIVFFEVLVVMDVDGVYVEVVYM